MKRGTSVERMLDEHSNEIVEIRKTRGKITVQEIEEILRYGRDMHGDYLHGHYALLLNCSEGTCEGSGFYDVTDPPGDLVRLRKLFEADTCPVCTEMLPPFEYCPHCGKEWKFEKSE